MITWKAYHIKIFSELGTLIFDYPFRETDRNCAIAKCETFLKRYIAKKPRKATMTIDERSETLFEYDRKYCAAKYPKTAPMFDLGATSLLNQQTPSFLKPTVEQKTLESFTENSMPGFMPRMSADGNYNQLESGWHSDY